MAMPADADDNIYPFPGHADANERVLDPEPRRQSRVAAFMDYLREVGAAAAAGAAKGAAKGASLSAPPAWRYVGNLGATTHAQAHQTANAAHARVNRFFQVRPFTRYPSLSVADRLRHHTQLSNAWTTYHNEMRRSDQLELQRRSDVHTHRQAQAQRRPLMRLKGARAAVLQQLEQDRLVERQRFSPHQTAFNQAKSYYETTKAAAPLVWPWNWGIRYRSRRAFKMAAAQYKIEKEIYDLEMKRINKEGHRGWMFGIIGGWRLRRAALNLRDQIRTQHDLAEGTHQADNAAKRHAVRQVKGDFLGRLMGGVEGSAKRDLRRAREAVGIERARARHGRWENLKHDTKVAANKAGNSSVKNFHKAKGNGAYLLATVAKPFAALGAGLVGGVAGAATKGFQKARHAHRRRMTQPPPTP